MTLSNAPARLGAVLAGGRSRRFGSDKARAMWGERTLLDHAAKTLEPWTTAIIVVGRYNVDYQYVADRPSRDMGPLGGLCGALRYAADAGFGGVLTIACDMPTVPDALLAALTEGGSRWCASAPVLGYWESHLAHMLEQHLANDGDRSIRGWASLAGAAPVEWDALPNINTPADLAAL